MNTKTALIFGYNEYTREIVKNISHKYENIKVFKEEGCLDKLDLQKYEVEIFDFSDSWSDLGNRYDIKNSVAFCVLEDDAENIFLTISLRSTFKNLKIIALSKNKESANKLTMAGANKVIPVVETVASIISEILQKPVITEVLHDILYEHSDLKIAQIKIEEIGCFDGRYPSDVDWSREHGIVVLSIIHEDLSSEFIYSSKAKHHPIKKGDILVIVGYTLDIEIFEKLIRRDSCVLE